MPRMPILTTREQDSFNKPPLLNHEERKQYFDFPKRLLDKARTLQHPTNQIGFLLLCGYFRATKRFFSPQDFHERDKAIVAYTLGLSATEFVPQDYKKASRIRHQQIIRDYYGFKVFDRAAKALIQHEIILMSSYYMKPRLIFDRCHDILMQKHFIFSEAGTVCELIRQSLQTHKRALMLRMNDQLTPETSALLDSLFMREQNYQLTLLKRLSQSTKPAKVREYIADFHTIEELHKKLAPILDGLKLGAVGTRYYAGSVIKSQIFQLQQRAKLDRYIHVCAFVAHQYYRMQDNLVDIFLNVMTSFQTTIANQRKEKALEKQEAQQNQLQKLVQGLEIGIFSLIQEIRTITHDNVLADTEKIHLIKESFNREKPHNIEDIREEFLESSHDLALYDLQESKSLRLQNRLSPVLKAVNFQREQESSPLMEAITYFRNKDGHITEQAPINFLTEPERKVLYKKEGTFRVSLYKVFLFQHVAAAIKSGKLNLEHSYKYQPLDSYMISRERWDKEKQHLLERAELSNFLDPKTTLQQLDHALYEQYQTTNARVLQNEYLSFKATGTFCIKTPPLEAQETDPLQPWFPKRHYIPLAEILETVHRYSNMLSSFEHWQQTHISPIISHPVLLAGIIGLGCAIGVRKMASISSHVNENDLDHTINWRFSLENIREANDKVLTMMTKMELPNIYRHRQDQLHTASDGQKFEVRTESLLASRSFKYFGQGQGISAYTFIDERHFLWYSTIISASDRESTYVIDGLMRNDVVKSNIHSTDTHGYSEAIFGLTHMLGFSFAPRLKGLKNKQLYIFKHHKREERKAWKVIPDRYINEKILEHNWDDLLRLITTIKLKENTASDIFRRLNSYSNQHVLYQTIKCFGQIIKSLFILRYLDDVKLRQAIEKQLNKIELANRFTRAVAIGNPREFTQAEKDDQEIAESCNRLIKNSIICWNYLYLTHKLKKITNDEEKETFIGVISSHSIMTWAHINMLGEYDFSEEKRKDSIGILPPKIPT